MKTERMLNLALIAALALTFSLSADPANTASWDWTVDTGNTTPQTAADWSIPANWGGTVPSGQDWTASLTGATGARYIRIPYATSIGKVVGTYSGNNIVYLISDETVTFIPITTTTRVYTGNFSAYLRSTWEGDFGTTGTLYFNGPIAGDRLTLGSGYTYISLANFAESSSETLVDPVDINFVYHGSAQLDFISPNGCSAAQTGTWATTAGSRYATPVSVPGGFVPLSGAAIACDAFPTGTFVKRVFPGNVFEMSAVATNTAASATVTFAAHTPSAHIRIGKYQRASYVTHKLWVDRHPGAGEFRVEIGEFVADKASASGVTTNEAVLITTSSVVFQPGTLVIHDVKSSNIDFSLGNCHLELAETSGGGASCFTNASFRSDSASSVATVTVTNGLTAVMPNFRRWTGTLVKDGAGTLSLDFTNDVARNTGTLVVKEGTVTLAEGSWIQTLAVSNGATVQIAGEFAPTEFIAEPGARITGAGTLVLPDRSHFAALDYGADVAVRIVGGSGLVYIDPPPTNIVGSPAFWVDASRTDTMTLDGTSVTRWNDVRKASEDDGYLYGSTSILGSQAPTLNSDANGNPNNVDFGSRNANTCDITAVKELVWNEPITNIYSVFLVQDVGRGGGQFLGTTERLYNIIKRANDFTRDASAGEHWNNPIVYPNNSGLFQKAVYNADFYQNGHRSSITGQYLYNGGPQNTGSGTRQQYLPIVTELVNSSLPLAADTFSFDYGNGTVMGRNGCTRVCELIIYTNKLSYAERLAIAGHLMKKWTDSDIYYETAEKGTLGTLDAANSPALEAADGETLVVDGVNGSGAIVKDGAGTLYVADVADSNSDLHVKGGVMTIHSEPALTAASLPGSPLFDFDADDTNKMTMVSGTSNISQWKSSVGTVTLSAYHHGSKPNQTRPVLQENQLNGLPLVDFGPAVFVADATESSAFSFARIDTIQSIFMVQNTAGGGLPLLGESGSYSYGGLLRGNWYTKRSVGPFNNPSDPILSTDYAGGFGGKYASGGARVRLNGEAVAKPDETGFTGGNDLVSSVAYFEISSCTIGFLCGHMSIYGGGKLGEFIAYDRGLSDHDQRKVDAYLRQKWFGETTPGFRPAVAGAVTVDAGAMLTVEGGGELTASSLSGAGTVSGSVKVVEGGDVVVVVDDDGEPVTLTVSGALDLSAGGTVRLTGALARLVPGDYRIVSATDFTGSAANWTLDVTGVSPRRVLSLVADANGLVLRVTRRGSLLLVR